VVVFMVVRGAVFVWSQPVQGSILDTANWLNAITPLSAAMLPVIGTTAFLVLCAERLQGHLAQRAVELDAKNSALNAAIRAREDAERIARHDLKTPLASIAATPALLRAIAPPNPEQEQLLGMVELAANRALSMVKLSLDLYHMENGSYVFQPECVDVAGIASSVMHDLRAHAASKGVRLERHPQAEAVWVAADAALCYCCMANLLKNAVEAASDGSVVTVRMTQGPRVRVAIHNRGVVPLALRERFFEKYATQGKLGGTGLGTYSSHLMARAQGGSLAMDTSDALGTTTVTLELQPFHSPPHSAVTEPSSHARPDNATTAAPGQAQPLATPLRVLIADDDPYNRKVLCGQLPSSGVVVDTAINGREAFERCLAARPDVVFMDLEMPVQGGVEAMQHIRALQAARRQAASLICAFSSDNDAHNQARYLAMGFDHCLVKPSSVERVAQLLQRAAAEAPGRGPVVALPPKLAGSVQVKQALVPDVTAFLQSRLDLLAQLQAAASTHDRATVRRLAHTLTGSLAMFGFEGAADVCEQLERQSADLDPAVLAAQLGHLVAHLCTVPIETLPP
jgi:signal transduction histidine kinase/CheY-like chemotaxis protein